MTSKLPHYFPRRAATKRVTLEGSSSSDLLAMATTFRAAASKLLRERPYYPEALTDLPPLKMILGAANPPGMTSAIRAAAIAAGEAEFPFLSPIVSDADLMRATRNMVSEMCSRQNVPRTSMKVIVTEAACKLGSPSILLPGQSHHGVPSWKLCLPKDSYYIFGASAAAAAAAGLVFLSAGDPTKSNDTSAGQTSDTSAGQTSDTSAGQTSKDVSDVTGQTSDVLQDLKDKLSEVTDRAKNLDAENKRLREDADKVRDAQNQRAYEIQMEIVRSRHREELARIEARIKDNDGGKEKDDDGGKGKKGNEGGKGKKGNESGKDNKGDDSGKDNKGDESGKDKENKKDEKPLTKKLLDLLMAPSTAENFVKNVTSNWGKWSAIVAGVPILFGLSKADVLKILSGDLSIFDRRVEVVESRACPCGIPWPQKCSRCGRALPMFVGDSGLVSFPGLVVKGDTSAATPRATPPQPQQ